MKRFTITGKNVFRDNQERIYYVRLNDGTLISVENDPQIMAIIAWSQSSIEHRKEFIQRKFPHIIENFDIDWNDLKEEIKAEIINYQKSKMEIKA